MIDDTPDMTDAPAWPPTPDQLAWRPPLEDPDEVRAHDLRIAGALPDWVAAPADADRDDEELEVPAFSLAHVIIDANRPGGGGSAGVCAVRRTDGDLVVVVTNDEGMDCQVAIERTSALPTLGELLAILDDPGTFGIGHGARVNSDVADGREDLRGFVTIDSGRYPMLAGLDASREEQWISERP